MNLEQRTPVFTKCSGVQACIKNTSIPAFNTSQPGQRYDDRSIRTSALVYREERLQNEMTPELCNQTLGTQRTAVGCDVGSFRKFRVGSLALINMGNIAPFAKSDAVRPPFSSTRRIWAISRKLAMAKMGFASSDDVEGRWMAKSVAPTGWCSVSWC